ncbi:hypothetical protein MGG_16702 [Pyricularia oryzae 70-15]|uniref:Uncharacterized protein n=3 Tax=Pyricularia oryzae TaxID=318829 RepID=G4N3N9_PYRO7|nr:uncharacterized protein MGG_16702 [Pyricularia oryzae 70-15]EHA51863.1 hypothetical protein MGG_16702 [Pyricularia oryzae 70-15]ELQ34066.1 hypothetical protein OOU_Y34scaffold00807g4 [Pyricularia oryzae Y34]
MVDPGMTFARPASQTASLPSKILARISQALRNPGESEPCLVVSQQTFIALFTRQLAM